jgi:hypothetical protein
MIRMKTSICVLALVFAGSAAWAKIPPPPPPDEKAKAAAEEKKAKDAVAAEKAKAVQTEAEDRAVKNYQANMKKAGKPIPKPTPIVAAAPPQPMPPPAGGKAVPTPNTTGTKGATPPAAAASAKGHETGAMTPAGNTPPKGTDAPKDAQKAPKK